MALTDLVIMPGADYQAACNSIRAKTGRSGLIRSGDMATQIDSISIEDNATKLLDDTLTDLTTSASKISDYSFYKHKAIMNITADNAQSIGEYAFADCTNIKKVSAKSAASVGQRAFKSCLALTSVSLDNATEIGDYAFANTTLDYGDAQLTQLSLPKANTGGTGVFQYSTITGEANFPFTALGDYAFSNCFKLTSLTLPNLSEVPGYMCSNSTSIVSASIPSATKIGQHSFDGIRTLETVNMPEALTISQYAFNGDISLRDISIPKVKTISTYAFTGCKGITEVDIPNCTYLWNYAFQGCTSIVTVNAQSLVSDVGTAVFSGCTSLANVNLESLKKAANDMFKNCTSLRSISLPSVTSISTSALKTCTNLETLILAGSAMATLGDAASLSGTKIAKGTGYIYVPNSLIATYQADAKWRTYSAQFRAIEDYPDIAG